MGFPSVRKKMLYQEKKPKGPHYLYYNVGAWEI